MTTVPWTGIDANGGHPNGTNSGELQHAVRRYTVQPGEVGPLAIDFDLAKSNPNGGGVTGYVYHNGTLLSSLGVAGWDSLGWDGYALVPNAAPGDTIDVVLGPDGLSSFLGYGGNTDDGADGSLFSARIYMVPEPGTTAMSLLAAGTLLLARRRRL